MEEPVATPYLVIETIAAEAPVDLSTTTELTTTTTTEVALPEEDMDIGETLMTIFTVVIPNTGYFVVSMFGTYLQMMTDNVQRNIVAPVLTTLGSFFDIPLNSSGFNLVALATDIGNMVMTPLQELGDFISTGVTVGVEYVTPILNCIGSAIKTTQDLLLGVFQIFPGCVGSVSQEVVRIIVDSMQVIDQLNEVAGVVMNTLSNCISNPLLCIMTVSLKEGSGD